ncbi:hypothetical protein [Ascidiaceihabitans sp.]|uniref:hypothetical protein n=1 Tax=Ascidiaceihabitans sp. TaxID=1872644 RepID=UPI0032988B61
MDIGPVSLFDNVKSNKPADCVNLDFDDFVEIMSAYAQDKFSCKSDAPLICVTEFKDSRRSKANAMQSGMVVLDVDDHLTVDEVLDNLRHEGIAALLCSTASHRDDHHKFRVFIPLLEIADYDDHVLAWHVLNHAVADGKADPSKIGCESMFFVPGTYSGAPQVFEQIDGYSLSAGDWIGLVGSEADILAMAGKAPSAKRVVSRNENSRRLASLEITDSDLDLSRSRLVSDKALDLYRAPSGSYHHARYALLMSMAGRARQFGLVPSAEDLRSLFNQIDQEDGGHYQTSDYQNALLAEAKKVISNS